MGLSRIRKTGAARSSGDTTMIRRRDQRSMKTPANGPITEYGRIVTARATANPDTLVAFSGENAIEETSAAWMNPSAV